MPQPTLKRPQWLPSDLALVVTADGSLTLSDVGPFASHSGERMHHSGGALSESQYVYLPALQWLRPGPNDPSGPVMCCAQAIERRNTAVVVVGLGLGYLELLTAAWWLRHGDSSVSSLSLITYESNDALSAAFLGWVCGEQSDLHHQVARQVANACEIDTRALRSLLLCLYRSGHWTICGDFVAGVRSGELGFLMHETEEAVILFDAYSPSSNPEIWDRDFLGLFLSHFDSVSRCSFATYASRTALKAILRSNGFTLMKRKGFALKRECTLALRGARGHTNDRNECAVGRAESGSPGAQLSQLRF